ncbi:MAG: phenylalanine--tRNA ligase subunit beta [Candidatus Dojkabacteria bacterium]|nr:MAG: phenylalanine--tRNA ligase subunit beta [Candidatus Dojkabacteria bacterium]
MKYSLTQIKKYIPELVTIPTDELITRIWGSIAEVESVVDYKKKFEGIVVAKVLSVEEHPRSSKLVVATVDCGASEPVTVVTGAKNFAVGDFVPYLSVGATVPAMTDEQGNPLEIEIRTMVGIPSVGMLASERELGLSDDHSGIMILRPEEVRFDLVPGAALSSVLEYDDVIFEIENKSLTHRGDCFSNAGIAREIATLYNLPVTIPEWQLPSQQTADLLGKEFDKELPCKISIKLSALSAVERYSAIVLDGVQVRPSPLWLRAYLTKHGINPVNNVVDVTNYVMLEYGQPMHAFDASTVLHKTRDEKVDFQIDVRFSEGGEKLETLDGKVRTLGQNVTLITDTQEPLALAGIIGGKASGITADSTRIILESAVFNKYAIRNASMALGVTTDASILFSRKQDPEKTVRALLRAVHLLQELASAQVVSPIADDYPPQKLSTTIVVSHEKLEEFLGIALSVGNVEQILTGLGCEVQRKNGMYRIDTPSWRPDLAIDEDIYEEIARMVEYKNITPELPKRGIFGVSLDSYEQVKQTILSVLTGIGYSQGMNFSFVSKDQYSLCRVSLDDAQKISNAISPDVQYMRKHVLPGLFSQLTKNQYNAPLFGIFEIGKTSRRTMRYTGAPVEELHMPESSFGIDELGLPIEDEHLSLGIIDDSKQPGYFTLKHSIETLAARLRMTVSFLHPSSLSAKEKKALPVWLVELLSFYREGRVALIYAGDQEVLGVIGEPKSAILTDAGITKQIALAEVSLPKLSRFATLDPVYTEPSRYPTVTEDYCFEVPVSVAYSSIIQKIEKAALLYKAEVTVSLRPRDIFQKKEETKQVTVSVTYMPLKQSLSEREVQMYRNSLVFSVQEVGGKLV